MMVETTEIRIGAAIPPELHARMQAIRAQLSVDGTPDGGPSVSAIIRQALEAWVSERAVGLEKLKAEV